MSRKEKQNRFELLLNPSDQIIYQNLRKQLSYPENRYIRNKRAQAFGDNLLILKNFCQRNDANDWKRYLACGIVWMNNSIAINTHTLGYTLGKSKSTINGGFLKMGYEGGPLRANEIKHLIELIPYLGTIKEELHQWTIRQHKSSLLQNDFSKTHITQYVSQNQSTTSPLNIMNTNNNQQKDSGNNEYDQRVIFSEPEEVLNDPFFPEYDYSWDLMMDQ